MTRSAAIVLLAVLLIVIFLPAVIVSPGRQGYRLPENKTTGDPDEHGEYRDDSLSIRLFQADSDQVVTMDFEDYLLGVVMAEMPASFGLEALKAQAVIARTYALRRVRLLGGSGCGKADEPADICSDSTHCQAWVDPFKTAEEWWPADRREDYLARIRQAVQDTGGEVVVYQGSPIEAVYHSACGGLTEASHAVWSGGSLPYLQSLPCEYCSHSPYSYHETPVTFEQLTAAFEQDLPIPVSTAEELPLEITGQTPGRRVEAIRVNEAVFKGTEVRRLLNLPSAAFSWELQSDGLLFVSRGHGHGVGLCQYGADGMAAADKSYRQIISYYYPGTDIAVIFQ